MSNLIRHQDVTEFEPHRFCAEAREIGLRPGEWPEILPTEIGNKLPFLRRTKRVRDGDLLWVTYEQANGCVSLRVFND